MAKSQKLLISPFLSETGDVPLNVQVFILSSTVQSQHKHYEVGSPVKIFDILKSLESFPCKELLCCSFDTKYINIHGLIEFSFANNFTVPDRR